MKVVTISPPQEAEILARHESHFFDFKRARLEPAKLEKTVVAFANADGGEAFVGLDDDSTLPPNKRMYGFKLIEDANDHVAAVGRGISPSISGIELEFCVFPADTAQLVLRINVPKSREVHYTSSKDCFRRSGASNLPVKGDDLTRLQFAKGLASFEDVPCNSIRVKDLIESNYLKGYLVRVPTSQPPEEFLRKQRLVDLEEQNHFRGPRVLNAAALLFDDEPQAAVSTKCGVKIIRLETTKEQYRRDYLADAPILTIEGPLEYQIRDTVKEIGRIMASVTFRTSKGYQPLRYPAEAVHEIVTNSIIHRDYGIRDDVKVIIFDNRIEVWSPGQLPGSLTVKTILQDRFARNHKIVRQLNRLPDAPNKDIGEGLKTAFDAMRTARLKPPIIEANDNSVCVTLRHETIASPESQIVDWLKTNATVRNKEGREITGIQSENTMKNILARMVANEIITPVDPTSSKFEREYRLKEGWDQRWEEPSRDS